MTRREQIWGNFDQYKDYTDARIREGIEKNRKGQFAITVTDDKGHAIPKATIHLRQTKHEFKYGANIFMLDQLETPEKNAAYEKAFREAFNMATLPFYWNSLEPERGKPRYSADSPAIYRRPPTDLCLDFCQKYGIEAREHALAYEHSFPQWLKDASVDEVKVALEQRYREIAERYADKIPTIEVTNEMFWDKGATAFYRSDDYLDWCYQMAEKYFPNNIITINEWSDVWKDRRFNVATYYLMIQNLLLRGRRIDAVALQYHMFYQKEEVEKTAPFYNPHNLYDVLDHYGKLERPIHISEVTIPAYSNAPEDEELQADLIEKLYSIWFSHPNVQQIIYWNLVDGYAYMAEPGDMTSGENYYYGGLLRFDLTPKPAFHRIKNLFENVWHTEEHLVTNENGVVPFSGFYGDYEITITAGEKSIVKHLSFHSGKPSDSCIVL